MTLVKDSWAALRRYTPARVGLGRTGVSLPTPRHLELQESLALARDAVYAAFEPDAIAAELRARGMEVVECTSAAQDRNTYLRRPDLGRRLSPSSRTLLESRKGTSADLALVVADGLSAEAARAHSAGLLGALRDLLPPATWHLSPVVLVRQGRVAVGDEIGALLRADAVIVLIGERPGLSSIDSLGAYVTWKPHVGRRDAERNCISNIRTGGLSIADAAHSLASLLSAACANGRTGVALSQALASGTPPHTARLER